MLDKFFGMPFTRGENFLPKRGEYISGGRYRTSALTLLNDRQSNGFQRPNWDGKEEQAAQSEIALANKTMGQRSVCHGNPGGPLGLS